MKNLLKTLALNRLSTIFINEHEIPDIDKKATALSHGEYRITNVNGVGEQNGATRET